MNRRSFLGSAAAIGLAGASGLSAAAAPADLLHHRFGLNYTPSRNWWFCWNDWDADPIRRDLDAIHALGADHLRILLVWPFFQPNPAWVSPAHLDRLDQLVTLMGERNLDALVTVFTGQLSGWYFLPPFQKTGSGIYTDPEMGRAQRLLLGELSRVLNRHSNFLGFDFGNEMNTCWQAPLADGDAWMARTFVAMEQLSPGRLHVNGVDHMPWFEPATFSPQALARARFPVIHAYPYWSQALRYGGAFDPPSTKILAAFATLVRAYAGSAQKPVFAGEFNTCIQELDENRQAAWLEQAVTAGVEAGVSWFTYWDSHDVDRRFQFNPLEYSLGVLANDGRVKEQGKTFRRLAEAFRGKPVRLPKGEPRTPPAAHTQEATWQWLLDVLEWKPRG